MGSGMRRLSVAFVAAVVGCAPVAAGPELPRPAQPAGSAPVVTLPPTTVTTSEVMDSTTGPTCPTPFCVEYAIDPDATWGDGTPVTADDFIRTYRLGLAEGAEGYETIAGFESSDPKQLTVQFSAPYGAWAGLFSRLIAPGPVASGGYQLEDWVPGDSIVVSRVPDGWSAEDPVSGGALGTVEQVTFVFMSDLDEMVEALEDGEVDVIVGRPDTDAIEELAEMDDVVTSVAPGLFWEHITFHHDDPTLSRPWLRRAIAMAIDREGLIDATARLVQPDAAGLDNTIFMSRTRHYEDHYDMAFDPVAAEQILVENGCVRDGGPYVCGDTPLSFTWATTNDDPARREAFDLIEEDLEAIGVEIVPLFMTPSSFVASDFLLGGPDQWQMANFSWRVVDDPGQSADMYRCDESVLNVNRYCSSEVEAIVDEAEASADEARRTDLYNQADLLYLDDIAVIPLYQKPELMAWRAELSGPIHNHSRSSDLWNIASWTGFDSVVVAIPGEPSSLDPFSIADENANIVMATLMYGAFAMDPAYEFLPVLVESARVIEG